MLEPQLQLLLAQLQMRAPEVQHSHHLRGHVNGVGLEASKFILALGKWAGHGVVVRSPTEREAHQV